MHFGFARPAPTVTSSSALQEIPSYKFFLALKLSAGLGHLLLPAVSLEKTGNFRTHMVKSQIRHEVQK